MRRACRTANAIAALTLSTMIGCAGTYESSVRHDLSRARRHYAPPPTPVASEPATESSTRPVAAGLAAYVRLALERNPSIRAGFERWQASVHRISRARQLPEPTIAFGYFVQSVETRVGPQRARISLQQAFPWPTKLTAGADAASAQARAMQRRFEAQALSVTQRVAAAYWALWQIRTTKAIRGEHLILIRGLSETVGARMSTGAATLADLQQIDLAAARIEDNIRGMDEAERGAEAQLRAAIGLTSDVPVPTREAPGAATLPADPPEALTSSVRAHPKIESLGFLAEASEATAQAESAERLPSFTVGADWIITGDAAMPGVEGSGRDAVVVGGGMRIPLWQTSYSESAAAAEAEARAQLAEQRSLIDRAQAELASTLAHLRDAARRVELYRMTLVPQAEAAYESVLGAYTVGRATVAQALLSQRDLLDLRIELEQARADHARSWARVEELVGHQLAVTADQPERPPPGASSEQRGHY
jgi:outer membrane protein, heavy metal efflux system